MIEITLRDAKGNCIDKATGDIIFFAAINADKVYSQIRGSETTMNIMQLYTTLKEVKKYIEKRQPIVKFLECFSSPVSTVIDLSPIEEMKKGEG